MPLATNNSTVASSGSGNITFTNLVNGAFGLTVNTAGTTAFQNNVGNSTTLTTLTTNSGGTTTFGTAIQAVTVKPSCAQTYGDAVSLLNNTTLGVSGTTTGNVTLGGTVDGGFALNVNTSGTTSFQ